MKHLLHSVHQHGNKYVAQCACGSEHTHKDRATAVALVFKHSIDANRPACPTPAKKAYGTETEAVNAMHRFWRSPTGGFRPVRAYKCPSGKHWHLSKKRVGVQVPTWKDGA